MFTAKQRFQRRRKDSAKFLRSQHPQSDVWPSLSLWYTLAGIDVEGKAQTSPGGELVASAFCSTSSFSVEGCQPFPIQGPAYLAGQKGLPCPWQLFPREFDPHLPSFLGGGGARSPNEGHAGSDE